MNLLLLVILTVGIVYLAYSGQISQNIAIILELALIIVLSLLDQDIEHLLISTDFNSFKLQITNNMNDLNPRVNASTKTSLTTLQTKIVAIPSTYDANSISTVASKLSDVYTFLLSDTNIPVIATDPKMNEILIVLGDMTQQLLSFIASRSDYEFGGNTADITSFKNNTSQYITSLGAVAGFTSNQIAGLNAMKTTINTLPNSFSLTSLADVSNVHSILHNIDIKSIAIRPLVNYRGSLTFSLHVINNTNLKNLVTQFINISRAVNSILTNLQAQQAQQAQLAQQVQVDSPRQQPIIQCYLVQQAPQVGVPASSIAQGGRVGHDRLNI